MKKLMVASLLLICSAAMGAQAQIPNFKHIIVVVQENRTPDNLFQGLCGSGERWPQM